jgi:hypothetical protein
MTRSIISLIWGVKADYPCPRCLNHKANLWDVVAKAPLRTTKNMKAKVDEARKQAARDKEKTLRAVGLRDVDV